jgi:hypothetical protein
LSVNFTLSSSTEQSTSKSAESEEKMDSDELNDVDEEEEFANRSLIDVVADEISDGSDSDLNESLDDSDIDEITPLQEQKSKLKVFEKSLALVSHLCDAAVVNQQNEPFAYRLRLNFFYKCILDELSMGNVRSVMLAMFRLDNPNGSKNGRLNRENRLFARKIVDMCCRSIQKMHEKLSGANSGGGSDRKPQTIKLDADDRCVAFYSMMGMLLELSDEEQLKERRDQYLISLGAHFTDLIVRKLFYLLMQCGAYYTLQWLVSICQQHRQISEWLLENMELWAKELLIEHKHTNVRYSAAVLLKQLVPNRAFQVVYSQNRNILLPFNPSIKLPANVEASDDSSEPNLSFDSVECKRVCSFDMIFFNLKTCFQLNYF